MDWRKSRLRLLPVTLVMAGIFYQSHQPGDSFSLPNIINIDKFLHILVYGVLGLSFLFALPPHRRRQGPFLTGCAVVLFCLFYGAIDEFHQSFIPGRFASGADLIADAGGGFLAAIGYWGWKHWQKKRAPEAAP